MHYDVLIIGQGISGTFLSHCLLKSNLSFLIIDDARPNAASRASSGVINPITGRRLVKTWMIEELMAYAIKSYRQIGEDLGIECIQETKMIDFFPTPQIRDAFLSRYEADKTFLNLPENENNLRGYFNYDFGYGEIRPVYLINIQPLISSFRKKMFAAGKLLEANFKATKLKVEEHKISYNDISADKLVFCDGMESFTNPWFKNLPFAPNKGEALIIEAKDFYAEDVFKKGISIVPLKNNLFWVGSTYEWKFTNDQPSKTFCKKTETLLNQWLKAPFKIISHFASVRPATLERRPFVGFHPVYKNIGILNGMGTKGCSLAPYFAHQLVQNIINRSPIQREADVLRFEKMLRRS
ncbi:MAG: FAD-binding oxidoreductase [Bacteroidetes bacterium]|nr:FAD-binding oxidoreductase [Bacteroidota bacterium]